MLADIEERVDGIVTPGFQQWLQKYVGFIVPSKLFQDPGRPEDRSL